MKIEEFKLHKKNVFQNVNKIEIEKLRKFKNIKFGVNGELDKLRTYSDEDTIFVVVDSRHLLFSIVCVMRYILKVENINFCLDLDNDLIKINISAKDRISKYIKSKFSKNRKV